MAARDWDGRDRSDTWQVGDNMREPRGDGTALIPNCGGCYPSKCVTKLEYNYTSTHTHTHKCMYLDCTNVKILVLVLYFSYAKGYH